MCRPATELIVARDGHPGQAGGTQLSTHFESDSPMKVYSQNHARLRLKHLCNAE